MTGPVDDEALQRCADEPIAVPGAVQPHGVLLAVTEPGLDVVVASANAAELFGGTPAGLAELLDGDALARLRDGLAGDLAEVNPLRVTVAGAEVDLVLHRADGLLLTEWEPVAGAEQAGAAWHRRLPSVLQRLAASTTLEQLSATLARDVRTVTGFDRVMVYRFDPDWNGEVIAEARREDLEPFLDLRFPASDIPAQARALYTTNWMRLIPDAGYTPVPLVPAADPRTGRPLDLSGAMLRSVSPVHLEYLANMGVVSSMSVSLIDRGRLWGLISCHHYAGPHRPSYADRTAAEFLGRTASLLLRTVVAESELDGVVDVAERAAELTAAVGRTPRALGAALTEQDVTVLDLVPGGGAAVRLGGQLRLLGTTPPAERVRGLVGALLAAGVTATDSASVRRARRGRPPRHRQRRARRPAGPGDFLAWFRPETLREVTWGGNPYESKVAQTDDGPRLSPRRSFDAWSEIVRGTSAPWREHEVAAARALAGHLAAATLNRTEEDNRLVGALQRTLLLEELPKVARRRDGRAVRAQRRGRRRRRLVRPRPPAGRRSSPSSSGTSPGTGWPPRRSPPSCGTHCGRTCCAPRARPRRSGCSTRSRRAAAGGDGDRRGRRAGSRDRGGRRRERRAPAGAARARRRGRATSWAAADRRSGVLDAPTYAEARLTLTGDDRLLLFSDGLVERGRGGLQPGWPRCGGGRRGAGRARSPCSSRCSARSRRPVPTTSPCWPSPAPEPHPSQAVWRHAS